MGLRSTFGISSGGHRSAAALSLLAALGAAAGCSAHDDLAATPSVVAGPVFAAADYTIVSSYSAKAIEVYGWATTDGARTGQWDATGGDNQIWRVTPVADGAFTIASKHSGKCLDLLAWDGADGAAVGQFACDGRANQRWTLVGSGGDYEIRSAWNGKCLDVLGWSTANGAPVGVWECKGAENQRYVLHLATGAPPSPPPPGIADAGPDVSVPPPSPPSPTPPSPTAATKGRILAYLRGIEGTKALVGIENKSASTPTSDTDRVTAIAGKVSSFWGGDFGFGGGPVGDRPSTTAEARRQFAKGALVSLMYHACSPTRDEYCSWDDIGAANHAQLTDAQFTQLVTPGTTLHAAWIARLDLLARYFQELKDAGVVALFRPLHEMNQCVFWWSCHKGPSGSARLFQITHDYLQTTKGLDNIIWVWNVQDFTTLSTDVDVYSPGAAYFDIATLDVYNTGYTQSNYDAMRRIAGGKPIAIGECQFMPTAATLAQQSGWVYAMLWPDFIEQNRATLPALYAAENVVTLDEMPGW